jgi:ribosomal protein L11 methyltransferase
MIMSDKYLEFRFALPQDETTLDILPAALSGYGFEGILEDEQGIHCYIKKNAWSGSIETIISEISEMYHIPPFECLDTTEISNRNWNEEWERTIQPIRVTENIIITPSWHPVVDEEKIVLTIDPKMTFGTGYHETTRIMIRLMEQYIRSKHTVLDIGTGTGILAIASIHLGAASAVAVDTDDLTMDNGPENALRNNVSERVQFRVGSIEVVFEHQFDIVLANIIRNTIIELMDGMMEKVAPAGTLLLSGLLAGDHDSIAAEIQKRGFKVVSVMQENEWIGMAVQRP